MSKLQTLREALAVSPVNVPLMMLFAQACIDELNFDEAKRIFEKVGRIEPERLEAKLGIAQILRLTGHLSEAYVRAEALVQSDPRFAEGWLLLSQLAAGEGDMPQAREFYRRAMVIRPSLQDASLEDLIGYSAEAPTVQVMPEIGGEEDTWEDDTETPALPEEAVELPQISFDDVGGMENVKEEIRMKIIHPLQNRDLFRAYGKRPGGGVLLYGPPGCGKTLISQATAGEVRANFISVTLHQVLDLYMGNSEKNLHQLFQLARDHAPAILFFDEIDALAGDRRDFRDSGMRTLINQFLAEMDGNLSNNDGVLVLGATNAPWHLDSAFRRPGRFDRVIFTPPPEEVARRSIIEILAGELPVHRLDYGKLARLTKGFSGADLRAMFDLATERALSQAMKEGRVIPVSMVQLLPALRMVKPSTLAWLASAKQHALKAKQTGWYDDVLNYLKSHR